MREISRVKYFGGLGRTLAVSFLLFALIPMSVVGVIGYTKANDSLTREVQKGLSSAALLKTQQIRAHFDKLQGELKYQSETEANRRFLQELTAAFETSNQPLPHFVKSPAWMNLVDEHGADLVQLRNSFNYYDVFMIDNTGNILFTAAQENDLGQNMFDQRYDTTLFAAAGKRSLETGKLSFSDYEHYSPSGNMVFGFMTAPINDEMGERIGLLAIQFNIDPITQIMESGINLGRSAETYLVGMDKKLRSGLALDKSRMLISDQIRTEQTELILDHNAAGWGTDPAGEQAFVYEGPHGESVLGMHHEVNILNVVFAVIAEINEEEVFASSNHLLRLVVLLVGLTAGIVLVCGLALVRRIIGPVVQLSIGTRRVEEGDYSRLPEIKTGNEIGDLGQSFNAMVETLDRNREEARYREWFQAGQNELNAVMRGTQDLTELSRVIITFLAKYLDAEIGAFYTTNQDNRLKLTGSYAYSTRKHLANEFEYGEGLVGQAALEQERILLTRVPEEYIEINSGLGEAQPHAIVVQPIVRDYSVLGVIELGTLNSFPDKSLEFISSVSENIAVGLQTAMAHVQVQNLLEESQAQTEELAAQQEVLSKSNQDLAHQTKALKESETNLQAQQEELKCTNEELEEQTYQLEEQKNSISQKNRELERTRKEIEKKVEALAVASRYKSEFLANMSHELRTPLNSILLLSKHLADNKEQNLTEKQMECAATVHASGSELLNLINEVLDLAKVESGKMAFESETLAIDDITDSMRRNFQPLAEDKGITFDIRIAPGAPDTIRTDAQRLSQILKNLLSNAIKFTEQGGVVLEISYRDSTAPVTFMVTDTGPGIPEDKLETVFQAFKQADGSTSRKYGGTGLGLSISRELAQIMGGSLNLTSTPGKGSVFTLSLPATTPETVLDRPESDDGTDSVEADGATRGTTVSETALPSAPIVPIPEQMPVDSSPVRETPESEYIADDRTTINRDSYSILIIEDDPAFAEILRDTAREKGFKVLVAESGETGLHLTDLYNPDGIILDMGLPGMDGDAVLFRLKDNLATRHIPVHIISASDQTPEPMHMGAVGYLTKPVNMESMHRVFTRIEDVLAKKVNNILAVQPKKEIQEQIAELIGNGTVKTMMASTGREARTRLENESFDCIILELDLPDMSGWDLLVELNRDEMHQIPVIIHTERDLGADDLVMLEDFSRKFVIREAPSWEKLLDDTCLFLHRVETDLPTMTKEVIGQLHDKESILAGKNILIVDDDMRNVFSLTSVLEETGISIIAAKNGQEALAKLEDHPDTDLILMDIMMPVMDGYEAMRNIRKMGPEFSKLPIIALTAKAMKGDRAKCIEAGATDYLTKPVNMDKLLSMLRVWLYQLPEKATV